MPEDCTAISWIYYSAEYIKYFLILKWGQKEKCCLEYGSRQKIQKIHTYKNDMCISYINNLILIKLTTSLISKKKPMNDNGRYSGLYYISDSAMSWH